MQRWPGPGALLEAEGGHRAGSGTRELAAPGSLPGSFKAGRRAASPSGIQDLGLGPEPRGPGLGQEASPGVNQNLCWLSE